MKTIAGAKPLPTPSFDEDDGLAEIRAIAGDVAHSATKKTGTRTKKKAVTKRYRLRFSFWVNILNAEEELVADQIERLKNDRSFARVCRDGIMLVSDLRKGSSDLLVRLFDWLRAPLELYHELLTGETTMLYELFPDVKPTPPPPSREIENMQKKIDGLQDQVDLLKGILIKQSGPGAVDMTVKMSQQPGPRPLTHNSAPLPVDDDDDDLVIRKSATAGNEAAVNFIRSAFALNGMTYDGKQ